MKDKALLLCHLGLGDHIICNGMVMELLKQYREIYLPVYHHNAEHVSFMFAGMSVNVMRVSSDNEAEELASLYSNWDWDIIKTGNFGSDFLRTTNNFSLSFYEQIGVDFDCSWNSFHLHRDLDSEANLANKLGNPIRYIFLHEDEGRGLKIDRSLVREDLTVVRPDKSLSKTIFEYRGILEMAEEIHCIDSSFAALIDRIDLIQNKRIILHRYARLSPERGDQESLPTFYRKNWDILYE